MLRRTSRYMNDYILSGARRQRGPAVVDPSKLAAAHRVQQAQGEAAVESAGRRIGLSEQRLAEQQRQFQGRMGLAEQEFAAEKDIARKAELISTLGLGASIVDVGLEQKRHKERLAKRKEIIQKYRDIGDEDSQFFADMLEVM